ncbi:MAG: hypothetical protein IPH48_19565 [bacterium]|nr:hypothetical protein [bacterium]
MHISYRLLAILFAMLLTAATEAATPACREYGERAGWIGITPIAVAPYFQDSGRIIVNGDAVYVSGNVFSPWAGRLHVIDVSDSAAPVVVDSLNIFTADVEMRDNHLYVAAVGDGFNIVSLADPLHPELVGHLDYLDLGFGPNCVSLMGSFAYLSYDGPTGVVVDISDPSQPQVVGPFDIPWGIWALSCAGSTGYVGSNGDLVVLDCSDPLHPIQTEVISVPEELTEMTVLGNLGAAYGTSTIYLFDLTDPAHPSLQSTFIPQHGDQDQRFAVSGNLLLWITTFAAEIWDLSNPAQPQFVDVIDAVDGAFGYGIGPDRIYILDAAAYFARLAVMDYSSRSLESWAEMARPFGAFGSSNFDFAGDRLLTVNGTTLSVLDVPATGPVIQLGTLPMAPYGRLIDADGDLAVCWLQGGMRLVDVSAPATPVLRGSLPRDARIRLRGDYAYLAGYDSGNLPQLAVFDVTDPDEPVLVAGTVPTSDIIDLAVAGDLAVWADAGRTVLYDISSPTSPRILSEIHGGFSAGVDGDRLYIGRAQGGFVMYDISDPSTPVPVSSLVTLGYTIGFAFDGDYVYLNNQYCGCQIVDMGNPAAPRLAGTIFEPSSGNMQIRNGMIYFGITAAPLQCGGISAVELSPVPALSSPAVYPNPFNPSAVVAFELAGASEVRLAVHDLSGRRVAEIPSAHLEPGRHELRWDGRLRNGRPAPSGTYFFVLDTDEAQTVVKAALIK